MNSQGSFDPASIENRYGLDMACYLVHQARPRSVHIATSNSEVAVAAVRRLAWVERLTVQTPDVAVTVAMRLGRELAHSLSNEPDVVLVPFARPDLADPPIAARLILVGYNALSYKSAIVPGKVRDNIVAQLRWLRRRYQLEHQVGLLTPMFMARWFLSLAAGTRFAPNHFLRGQQAIDNIYETGALWWLGYITILVGRRRA